MIPLAYLLAFALLAFLASVVALLLAGLRLGQYVAAAIDEAVELLDHIWDELSLENEFLNDMDGGEGGPGGEELELEPEPAAAPTAGALVYKGKVYCLCPDCLPDDLPN